MSFLRSALVTLLELCREAEARGTETQAYLLGRRSRQECIVTTVLRAGNPIEQAALTRADYAASAVAMQPYLDRGEVLLGEAHRHPGLIGLSAGDRATLLSISEDRFPHYLAVVVATFHEQRAPVVTAHSVRDGLIIEHAVRTAENAYLALLPPATLRVLQIGAGSGGCLVAQQVCKLPLAHVLIVDGDEFEERNRSRHLAARSAIGKSKARSLAAYLRPRASVPVRGIHLEVSPATRPRITQLVDEHDLVINATGHPPTSILLSEICAQRQRVCIHAGVFARGSGGFVFLQTPGEACYACLYDLQRQQATDDPLTLDALTRQYGYTPEELSAHLGLWADVNLTAAVQAKVVLDYLKYGRDSRPNLYLIDNDTLAITARRVRPHPACTCQETV
ncbi:MAG TPA: ThiF family adenylyltransferase [Thermoanaerobaculia bacterium]|nr:ThiF family adenylyltransferase [Thermoanaerobaculia bacterium]